MLRIGPIAGLAVALTLACQGQNSAVTVASVESMIRMQQYESALTALKTALREKPDDARLWTLEGVCLGLQGNDGSAMTAFEHAIRISPHYVPALRGEIEILYKSGDKRAIPLLERLLQSDGKDQTGREMLGTLEQRAGNCRAAVTQFQQSREAMADHPASLEAYGYCLFRLDETAEAIPVFRQLMALVPGQAYPGYDLAVLLMARHEYAEAIQVLDPLLSAGQTDADVFSLGAEAYEATGNTPRAVELQREAIVLNPTDPTNYVLFATLAMAHDSFAVGIDMLNAGIEHIPENSSLYVSRGVLLEQLGKFDAAEADFKRAEQLGTAQSIADYAGDLTMVERNNPEEALARVGKQLKAHPDNVRLRLLQAQLLMTGAPAPGSAAFREALQDAQTAARNRPDLVEAHDELASLYMDLDRYPQAIEECQIALRYDPSNEAAMYHLVISMRHSGSSAAELQPMVRRLAAMHKKSLQHETDRKRYRLVEEASTSAHGGEAH